MVILGEYPVSIVRQWTGHTSTQRLHITHFKRSMLQVFSFPKTHIAPDGHFFMHMPQDMRRAGSIATLSLDIAVTFSGTDG